MPSGSSAHVLALYLVAHRGHLDWEPCRSGERCCCCQTVAALATPVPACMGATSALTSKPATLAPPSDCLAAFVVVVVVAVLRIVPSACGVVGGLRSQYPGLGREFCHLCHLSVLIVFISHDSMSSLHHSFVVLQHSPCSAVEPAICDGLCIPYGPYTLQGSVSLCAGLVAYPCCCEWRHGVPALYCSPLTVFLG